jgi:hypothetical protein
MILESEIRKRLAVVAEGALPLWDFYDWLDTNSIDMELDSSEEAIELVGEIDHLFAEYNRRVYLKDALRNKLASLANYSRVVPTGESTSKAFVSVLGWKSVPSSLMRYASGPSVPYAIVPAVLAVS